MPYWIQSTLLTTPAFLWVYALLGVPLALVVLPRPDWRHHPLVLMTAFALGPGVLTALMFVMGSMGAPLLTRGNVLTGLAVLTVAAIGGAVYKARRTSPALPAEQMPLTTGERILIVMIVLAVTIRWMVMAYWPFTAYDALWVYGYEGRLYLLEGLIPATIDYYPQFLPLQFTFGQLIVGGINDSAARAVIPLLHIGSILAAYNLGRHNFNRRTGIFLAALWSLYPAVGEWARMGDLEIPLAFLVTATAVFFFRAWDGQRPRHYALVAGLIYGVALWTKPTAGAFALGVMLLNVIELVRVRFQWADYRPRFMVSLITALACTPLGGVWYLRNIALGHNAVDFPPSYWHTLAERGGGQLLWYLAGLLTVLVFIYATEQRRPGGRLLWPGVGLLLAATVPSAVARYVPVAPEPVLWLYPSLDGLPRLGVFEWLLLIAGSGLTGLALFRYGRATLHGEALTRARKVGWMLAVTLPHFAVFFWRYSYHYRLAFAIVPLMAVPIAVTLAQWFPGRDVRAWHGGRRLALSTVIFLAALPGMILPLYDKFSGWDYLWNGDLADDTAKRASGNDALMWMVDGFQIYEQENGQPPVISAPGVQRLPFFFPTADIRIDEAPTRLSELDGVTYFVDSHPDGTGMYEGVPIFENQVLSALGREDIMRRAWWRDDGIFRYEVYELDLDNRFEEKQPVNAVEDEIIFGEFARFLGSDISSTTFQIGELRSLTLYWEVVGQAEQDYMIYIHLRDADGNVQMAWDAPVGLTEDGRYYTTLVWEPGEYIVDPRRMRLTNEDTPPGEGYSLVIGMYDLTTGARVPITRGGDPIGNGLRLDEDITVIPR